MDEFKFEIGQIVKVNRPTLSFGIHWENVLVKIIDCWKPDNRTFLYRVVVSEPEDEIAYPDTNCFTENELTSIWKMDLLI